MGRSYKDAIRALMAVGQVDEAAEIARAANNWKHAAKLYESTGRKTDAADVYRQIGLYDEATVCLREDGKSVEAAMLAVASGRREDGIAILRDEIGRTREVEGAAVLIELLLERGKNYRALTFVAETFASKGVNTDNAAVI